VLRPEPAPLTIGTAGHVDHGKTALVAQLTGTDTDRLEAEKARGLSIELGFAVLALPDGRAMSMIDVPGHEQFVRTMVAGATGIDCYLMVVAATEGARPQTHEHARILRALSIDAGIVVITKTDLADPATAVADARTLLPGAPIVVCPPAAGERRAPVVAALARLAAGLPGRAAAGGPAILHVDRSFTVAGAGTVVTGTLRSGRLALGDRLTLTPAGLDARVRGLQVHGAAVPVAAAGQRVAVNLARVTRSAVGRGDVLATPGAVSPVHVFDVAVDCALVDAAGRRLREVHVHHGTRSTPARVKHGDRGQRVRLACRRPLMARPGDPFVLRDPRGRDTLGGAVVVSAHPPRRAGRVARPPAAAPARPPHSGRETAPALPALGHAASALAERLEREGVRPTADARLPAVQRELLDELVARGMAVRLAHGRHASPVAVAAVEVELRALIERDGRTTLPALRDRLGGSRADAKAFLDYFDNAGVTLRRADDSRVLRRTARDRPRSGVDRPGAPGAEPDREGDPDDEHDDGEPVGHGDVGTGPRDGDEVVEGDVEQAAARGPEEARVEQQARGDGLPADRGGERQRARARQ
jgi:selenocysteine-specific elongation factor